MWCWGNMISRCYYPGVCISTIHLSFFPKHRYEWCMRILFYFFLVRTSRVNFSNAVLSSHSGKDSSAVNALAEYWPARSLVFSRPSDAATNSRAYSQCYSLDGMTLSTSPELSNFRLIIAPNSGYWSHANNTGAVANPSARSAFDGLPSIVAGAV